MTEQTPEPTVEGKTFDEWLRYYESFLNSTHAMDITRDLFDMGPDQYGIEGEPPDPGPVLP